MFSAFKIAFFLVCFFGSIASNWLFQAFSLKSLHTDDSGQMPKYEDIVVLLSEQCYFSHKTSWQQADLQTYRPHMKRVGTKHFLIIFFFFFPPNGPNLCPTNDALHI